MIRIAKLHGRGRWKRVDVIRLGMRRATVKYRGAFYFVPYTDFKALRFKRGSK